MAVVLKHGVVTDWQTFGSFDVIDLLTLRSCYWSEALADWVIFQNMSTDLSLINGGSLFMTWDFSQRTVFSFLMYEKYVF